MDGRKENGIINQGGGVSLCEEARIRSNQHRYWASMSVFILFLLGAIFSAPFDAVAEMNAEKAAIAAGVAAGTDISVIMKDTVASGMTVRQVVEELVLAGADPGRVVYEAITAKYATESVIIGVSTAVNQKYGSDPAALTTNVNAIITAATQAGESQGAVQGFVASAGVSPNIIANAGGSEGGGPKAPVEAYSPPGGESGGGALTSIIGGGGANVGGSGIGSTKTASNTKP